MHSKADLNVRILDFGGRCRDILLQTQEAEGSRVQMAFLE